MFFLSVHCCPKSKKQKRREDIPALHGMIFPVSSRKRAYFFSMAAARKIPAWVLPSGIRPARTSSTA